MLVLLSPAQKKQNPPPWIENTHKSKVEIRSYPPTQHWQQIRTNPEDHIAAPTRAHSIKRASLAQNKNLLNADTLT